MSAAEFYSHGTFPSTGAFGSSSAMRAELEAIETGFGKLPDLSGNGGKIVAINAGATALEAITTTGTGSGVRATSPTLVTPNIGVATGTSLTLSTTVLGTTGMKLAAVVNSTDKDANANTLDDYQEGTFTPVIEGSTSAGSGTYTTQIGDYTVIGNLCFFNITLVWTAHTGTGDMRITGLPFTTETGNRLYPVAGYYSNVTSPAGTIVVAAANPNSTRVDLFSNTVAGGAAANLNIDAAGTLYLTGHYLMNH
jgi:hypothetical protein